MKQHQFAFAFLLVTTTTAAAAPAVVSSSTHQQQQQQLHDIYSLAYWNRLAQPAVDSFIRTQSIDDVPPKNVIIFIGDGMGLATVGAARAYKAEQSGRHGTDYSQTPLSFERFPYSGLLKTSSVNYHVTDSAAGAVAILTGQKVRQYELNRQPNVEPNCQGASDESQWRREEQRTIDHGIAQLAIERNMSVGVVTTTRITHATPAAMYARDVERNAEANPSQNCTDIASQLLLHPGNALKVLFGGGASYLQPKQTGGLREDGRNIADEWLRQDERRRKWIRTTTELADLDPTKVDHVLGTFADDHLPYRLNSTLTQRPSLEEMTLKAIDVLETNNHNGYVLLVEGGLIDWAQHYLLMRETVEETLELDRTVAAVRRRLERNGQTDTLVVVTSDHGHAMTLAGNTPRNESVFAADDRDFWRKAKPLNSTDPKYILPIPHIIFVSGPRPLLNQGYNVTQLEAILGRNTSDQRAPAFVYAEKTTHGGEDVGVWSYGPYASMLTGSMENCELGYRLKFLLCLPSIDRLSLCEERRRNLDRFNGGGKGEQGSDEKEGDDGDGGDDVEERPPSSWSVGEHLLVAVLLGSVVLHAALVVWSLYGRQGRKPGNDRAVSRSATTASSMSCTTAAVSPSAQTATPNSPQEEHASSV